MGRKSARGGRELVVVVNADDFGISDAANASIIAAHQAGNVTSATIMANAGATASACALASANPLLGVGLHFNLTEGRPICAPSQVPSLVDGDGLFLGRASFLRRALVGGVSAKHVALELEAQLRVLASFGVVPGHFDSHQHAHLAPVVFKVLAAHAAAVHLPVRVPWRWSGRSDGKSLRRKVSEFALDFLVSRCVGSKPSSFRSNDGLCSVFDLDKHPLSLGVDDYRALLSEYGSGLVELMVHPVSAASHQAEADGFSGVAAFEGRLLQQPFLPELVRGLGGRLGTYTDAV
jgi:predicted glycoside hydrolase/deacetylase ChbG (UPF0249 family)